MWCKDWLGAFPILRSFRRQIGEHQLCAGIGVSFLSRCERCACGDQRQGDNEPLERAEAASSHIG